jgi:starch synthase
MYSMRYGTVPVVRETGGLRDTVIDYSETGGYGVTFKNAAVGDITEAIYRSTQLYDNKKKFKAVRKKMMGLDFSWTRSAKEYIDLYKSLK